MKQISRIVLTALAIVAVLFVRLGHVSAAQISETAGASTQKVEVTFTGPIESMDGANWVIDGKTVSVDPALVATGTFAVGDIVKVEGYLLPGGSVSAKQVELPNGADDNGNSNDSADDNSNDTNSNDDNSNDDNSNDDNSNDDNSNDDNSNDDNSNDNNSNDDNSNDDNSNDDNSNDDNSNDNDSDDSNENNSDDGSGNENASNSNGG